MFRYDAICRYARPFITSPSRPRTAVSRRAYCYYDGTTSSERLFTTRTARRDTCKKALTSRRPSEIRRRANTGGCDWYCPRRPLHKPLGCRVRRIYSRAWAVGFFFKPGRAAFRDYGRHRQRKIEVLCRDRDAPRHRGTASAWVGQKHTQRHRRWKGTGPLDDLYQRAPLFAALRFQPKSLRAPTVSAAPGERLLFARMSVRLFFFLESCPAGGKRG